MMEWKSSSRIKRAWLISGAAQEMITNITVQLRNELREATILDRRITSRQLSAEIIRNYAQAIEAIVNSNADPAEEPE